MTAAHRKCSQRLTSAMLARALGKMPRRGFQQDIAGAHPDRSRRGDGGVVGGFREA